MLLATHETLWCADLRPAFHTAALCGDLCKDQPLPALFNLNALKILKDPWTSTWFHRKCSIWIPLAPWTDSAAGACTSQTGWSSPNATLTFSEKSQRVFQEAYSLSNAVDSICARITEMGLLKIKNGRATEVSRWIQKIYNKIKLCQVRDNSKG